jgi:hypothetical protein
MSEYTNEQLIEMYHKLPKDVQEAILSVDTSEAIREIGEKHKLMIDKMGDLADETGLVMLGITHSGQYISHLIERLGIDQETAQEITEEVNNRILFPIRDSLRKIQEEREETAEVPEIIKPEIPAEVGPRPTSLGLEPLPPPASSLGEPASLLGEPPPIPPPPLAEEKPALETPSVPETATLISTLPSPLTGTPPPAPSVGGEPAIFQVKTKEEIFRQPLQTVEKMPEGKKFDPYKEPIS